MKNNGSFLLILFLTLVILVISIPQFVYAQTVENEIIENTLETVEKATGGENTLDIEKNTPSSLEITESAANNATQQDFQIEDTATNIGNATESAIAGVGETTEGSVAGTESAATNVTEGTESAIAS